jgi:ferredoxin
MAKITFLPANITAEYHRDESLFEAGARAGIDIETACVGQGTCGLCRVRIVAGEEFLNDYTEAELKHLGNVYFITKVRLSCRCRPAGGDVVVELAPKKRRHKKR